MKQRNILLLVLALLIVPGSKAVQKDRNGRQFIYHHWPGKVIIAIIVTQVGINGSIYTFFE